MVGTGGRTILLVEDESIIALAEAMALRKYGYQVVLAESGHRAIDLVEGNPEIALILMDIDLGPGIDGTEAARRILASHDIPILFLSSHTEPDIVSRTEEISSYGYVVKNSCPTVLDASIKMAFKLFAAKRMIQMINQDMEATLAALPDLLLEVDLDGRCHGCHLPANGQLSNPTVSLIGRNLSDFLPEQAAAKYRQAITESADKGWSMGKQYEQELPVGTFWFELSVSRKAGPGGSARFIILRRDISDRKRVEEDLRIHQVELKMQNEEYSRMQGDLEVVHLRYFDLYNQAPLGFAILDTDGNIIESNDTFAKQFGTSTGRLTGTTFSALINPDDQDDWYLCRKAANVPQSADHTAFCEARMIRTDGSHFPTRLMLKLLAARGTPVWLATVLPISPTTTGAAQS